VIIPAYNEAANIGKVLGQLAPLRAKYNLEILVSDDGSQDGTPGLAAPLCDRVITPRPGQQRGPGAARNRGALAAGSDLLLFIDADVVLEQPEEIIRRFLRAFQDQRVVSVTCAQNVFPDQARFNEWAFHTIQTWVMRAEHAMGVPVACGGCQAVRRKPFFAVGGYHQWLNMSQDLDMFIRVSAKGRSVYHHDLRVLTTPRRYRETGLFNNIRNIIINSWAVMLFGRGPVRGYHRAHQPVVDQEAQHRENQMAP
jgi:glycosyltransferase involved in cell wall biosynthesis